MKIEFMSEFKKAHIVLLVGTIVIIFAFGIGAVIASAATFKNFSAEFYIAGRDVSGLTVPQAEKLIASDVAVLSRGVRVEIPGFAPQTIQIPASALDVSETIASAKGVASRGALTRRMRDALGFAVREDVGLVVDENVIENLITQDLVASWNLPLSFPKNAGYELTAYGNAFQITPAIAGQNIDLSQMRADFLEALSAGKNSITASVIQSEPEITTAMAQDALGKFGDYAAEARKGRRIKIKEKVIEISSYDFAPLLQLKLQGSEVVLDVNPAALTGLIGAQAKALEQQPKNAVFQYDGTRVTKFEPHQTGVAIDWDAIARELRASLDSKSETITAATKDAEPEIKLESLNTLGINELIGVGSSDFKGSPKNRIHNITVGMNSLKNVLIAPGETFSLIKTLGNIDGEAGYLQELVIKDNKTQPEFGGGLCQIGTTVFRAAMGAGFPIVERRNHSYQVGYYFENGVSGTDATIYDPKPDFRFLNDTGHWVLLDPHMDGAILNFKFWGTPDGRKASRTIPKTLATQPAPPKKEIFTTDLPPGKVKCTEKAHSGATMMFTYSVEYPDGTVKKEDFKSYYKPWAEVCLVGVAATSTAPVSDVTIPAVISPDASGATGN